MEDLRSRVGATSWYHRIELPGGIVTPGAFDPRAMLARVALPERLDGRSVLDIGAWDGFWSFEAKKRGASRVLAIDSYTWEGQGWGSKQGFLTAREVLGLDIEDRTMDVMDLDPRLVGTFDVVLFLGVLYHLTDPIGALRNAASVASDLIIVETESSLSWLPFPAAAVFPSTELNDDPTNWWSLNHKALVGLLKGLGFGRVEVIWQPSWARRAVNMARQMVAPRHFASNRIVVHGRR